ncbi:hypothetical protein L6164_026668 [Bauhinia variegata]|uniref:Uncharacterized protein n=1 Tax=Bauhinia variegata TaxID=167791 RepID=A0ACB9LQI2_BAUVA|nr:hypothetical protein L6164_026668 [Bauhinia variegata]
MASTITSGSAEQNDKVKELKQFYETKTGVKGISDSGNDSIPSFFHYPPEAVAKIKPTSLPEIPVIDLAGFDSPDSRPAIVDKIRTACTTFGFFQIINHGVPLELFDRTLAAVKAFFELPAEGKASFYREKTERVSLGYNLDMNATKTANWRDTLQLLLGPTPLDPNEIPELCRNELTQWNRSVGRVGEVLSGLMSEGLGLSAGRLRELSMKETVTMAHYYPYCPQADLTVGFTPHTDLGGFTVVLLKKDSEGLQFKYEDGWVDLKPVPGGLIVNIGDFGQIVTNKEYKSIVHRVLANSYREARISIATFFNPGAGENTYGPLRELTSTEKPPLYRNFTWNEYVGSFYTRELSIDSMTSYFKL